MNNDCRRLTSFKCLVQKSSYTFAAIFTLLASTSTLHASTYFEEKRTCPVGGETFNYLALGSISTWGELPDGMPIGSGLFPVEMPKCPSNGLVMYRNFTPQEVAKLAAFVAGPDYKALIASGETPYYLAYKTAVFLGDAKPEWLLLSATWEAKGIADQGALARRYNEEFVIAAKLAPVSASEFDSIAVRFRAANALRELGRFDEAEAVRAAIIIAPNAGGSDENAAEDRVGWKNAIADLAAPIARKETRRGPIDMLTANDLVFRCLSQEVAKSLKQPLPPPLDAFEVANCARPEFAAPLNEQRKWLASQSEPQ